MLSVCGFLCEMSCPIPRGKYPVATFISCNVNITVWFIPCYSEGYQTITEFGGLYSKVGNLIRYCRCTRIKIISQASVSKVNLLIFQNLDEHKILNANNASSYYCENSQKQIILVVVNIT